jgi:hypothetical protein
MKRNISATVLLVVFTLVGLVSLGQAQEIVPSDEIQAATLGTAFTYQGRLVKNGQVADGDFDFQFKLYDAAETQVGSTISLSGIHVSNGLFTVSLDFGDVFNGEARYLEIAVQQTGSGSGFTTLTPRQSLLPAPYALYAQKVATHTHTSLAAADGDPADAVHVDNEGNVGIGTTNPAQRLHVVGDINLHSSDGGMIRWANLNDIGIKYSNSDYSGPGLGILSLEDVHVFLDTNNNGVPHTAFHVSTNGTTTASSTELFRVQRNGNVGIGTTNPQSRLEVDGYIQLDTVTGAPPAADCNEASEEGRMKFDPGSDLLYICSGASGWVSK